MQRSGIGHHPRPKGPPVLHHKRPDLGPGSVFVRTPNQMHAVMLPVFDWIESVPIYLDFLKNDNERIEVATGEFDTAKRCWTVYGDRRQQVWPKQGLLYPQVPDPIEWEAFEGRLTLPGYAHDA